MTWFVRKIVDLFSFLSGLYYSRKYAAIAKRIGRDPSAETTRRRGFIIVQVDGLSHEHLLEAMRRGYVPHMSRLLQRGHLRLARWRCGLPSTTPAVQAGIMFGNNFDIPAFRWYEKDTRISVLTKVPFLIRNVQERISRGRPGILREGSSYVNMVDGDARLALFTLSTLGSQRFFENVRGLGFLFLFLLSPWRVLRVITRSVWDYLVDLGKRIVGLFAPGRYQPFDVISPFLMILTNVVLREIQTFSAMIDIYRGMPAIYTNYYSYDEMAHHCGASSREAFSALRGIDHQIRQINRIRTQYHRREYDLYILSDHGLTPSVPFQKKYGQTLGQFIVQQLGEDLLMDEQGGSERQWTIKAQFLAQELAGIEARLSKRGAILLLRLIRQYVENRIPRAPEEIPWDLTRRRDVVVRNSGSLAHVYFNVSPEPMNLSEIALIYPPLLRALVEHEGIGWVVGREPGETVIMGKEGTRTLGQEDDIQGQDPLASLPEPEHAAAQLRRLTSFPHSGDLILLGSWNPEEGTVISFEDQVASHGGLGGPQDYPFVMYPTDVEMDAERITNSEDLYSHFMRLYNLEPPG
ncbi:MAG: alkaline phosphatase family protein [Anaerolineae bacterium]|jgi:hypothetical protein|nr:alkaline phosphatase family protein [Anaerolineae bacterium]MDH7473185.1 alkaline phosphatase family protein [Anaerolineae bacterium]